MTTYYAINGSAASIAPASVNWRRIQVGTDHNGAPIFSQNWEVDLVFPPASITMHKQWTDHASGGSLTLDIPGRDTLEFKTLSPVYLNYQGRPMLESVISTGFTLTVLRARDNA